MFRNFLAISIAVVATVYHVSGHGKLMEPPNRSSLWRFPEFAEYNPPANYNDNENYCGGAGIQHGQNGGKCGECGDAYHLPKPRANENGGTYGRGVIARRYRQGQVVDLDVDLNAAHKGHFEFRLCELNKLGSSTPEDSSCFDQHLLQLEAGGTNFEIGNGGPGHYYPRIRLPQGVTCSQCVLQWYYQAANNWGDCGNGTSASGCGPQETFVNCADIAIE